MTSELLLAICAAGLAVPMLLGVVAQRLRARPVPVRIRSVDGQRRPVNHSIER
jgi:hypothetical protein